MEYKEITIKVPTTGYDDFIDKIRMMYVHAKQGPTRKRGWAQLVTGLCGQEIQVHLNPYKNTIVPRIVTCPACKEHPNYELWVLKHAKIE